ncbi:hypothetical protein BSKO_11245 [Bryopsis sp. KO-2023]|nr:hypothetical protein BSKO_11245 [Bryopsis sp. KO-2023]
MSRQHSSCTKHIDRIRKARGLPPTQAPPSKRITTPKREPADNLLQNTFELLQGLVKKIDGGDGNPTKTSYLASERKPPQQAAAVGGGGVSGTSPGSCRSRLSNVHLERKSDHVAERLNRVIGMGSTEDMEMQKGIKKLHKERKKLVEKQKDIEAMSCKGGAASSTENEYQTQIDFLKLRSEQLSEENGRLGYQLAATSNGSPKDNLASTALPPFQPLSDQMPAATPSFQRSSEPSIIHPMESLTRFSTPPPAVSTLIPEKRTMKDDIHRDSWNPFQGDWLVKRMHFNFDERCPWGGSSVPMEICLDIS